MTSTALDLNHHPATALAIQPGQPTWDNTQLAALGQLGLADAGDGDRAVFLHVCQRTGLDPFARQIYMIARNEKVGRPVAQEVDDPDRHRRLPGQPRPRRETPRVRGILGRAIFYDHEGNEYKVWVQPRPPAACEITYTVRDRDGNETPYTSVLRFTEYCRPKDGNPVAQWATKPAHMLEKCTEADVYRKAFPQDFSGIYLDDAMPQDTPPADGAPDGAAARAGHRRRDRGRACGGDARRASPADEGAKEEPIRTPGARRPQPRPTPDLATSGQLSMIGQRLGKLGVDNENRLGTLEKLAGRDLEAATRLTRDEAAHHQGTPRPVHRRPGQPRPGRPRRAARHRPAARGGQGG